MDKNEEGVLSSLAYWKSKKNVYTAGSYTSFEDRDKVVIKEINGIKYAFLSYTTVTNGLTPPIGKEYLDNVYSEELAKADIERVRDKVDVVMVAMHWGVEYSNEVSTEQEKIANYLSGLGVDIIIGSHPHVIEPVDFIGKTLVIYSLGNYISDQEGTDRLIGLMMSVDIKKVVENKITTITLENTKADLLYTKSYVAKKRNFKVYPYEQVNSTILPTYQSYYEKYKNIICNPDAISNWIESNFNYENGTITSNSEGIYKGYQTWQFLKWFKYNYCLIGKPKRILIYHYPTNIIRKNAPQWFTNS